VATTAMEAEPDSLVSVLSIAALVLSLVSLGLAYWAFSATSLS
jgi:hypothetical protein